MKTGTKVKFSKKHLKFLKREAFTLHTRSGVIVDKEDFEKAAADWAIAHGAPYEAKVLNGDGHYSDVAKVAYKINGVSNYGYYMPDELEEK